MQARLLPYNHVIIQFSETAFPRLIKSPSIWFILQCRYTPFLKLVLTTQGPHSYTFVTFQSWNNCHLESYSLTVCEENPSLRICPRRRRYKLSFSMTISWITNILIGNYYYYYFYFNGKLIYLCFLSPLTELC
jgi:hypothetical protein